jgi:putative ABC transport system substrate-binding protein
MRRRDFITLLGGAAAVWPVVARAQQPAVPVVGFPRSTSFADAAHLVGALRQGLNEAGFVEGQNVAIEYRSAEDHGDRLPALVRDLVRRQVAVIVGNTPSVLAAKAATTTVPIVFASGDDPVDLVASLSRPGSNVTGVSFLNSALAAKRLELLHQIVPNATTIAAMLQNPVSSGIEGERRDLLATGTSDWAATRRPRCKQRPRDRDRLYNVDPTGGLGGIRGDRRVHELPTGTGRRAGSPTGIPANYNWREAVAAGGLMSYAPSITDAYRQAGIYAGRILKGEKPNDLPVMLPTKFEFVINSRPRRRSALKSPTGCSRWLTR